MKKTIYSIAYGTAVVTAVFSIVLVALIGANTYQLRSEPALNSPELALLIEKSQQNPGDETLKQTIRTLDRKARYVFFSSQHFNRNAGILAAAAVILMLIALKVMMTISHVIPRPGTPQDPDMGDPENLAMARWMLGGVAASLLALGVYMSVAPQIKVPPVEAPVAGGEKTNPVPAAGQAGEQYPSLEELRKNWPGFRGADGQGIAYSSNLPVAWDGKAGKGIIWKSGIPKPGANSPVVWGGKIFLTGADKDGRTVYCINSADGAMLWSKDVGLAKNSSAETGKVFEDTGLAASTVATDGRRVFAMFANGDLAALNMEGVQEWSINIGKPDNSYGFASSPVYFEGSVIIQFDQEAGGRVLAVSCRTGEILWDKPRSVSPAWASPVVIRRQNSSVVALAAAKVFAAYDCSTGLEQWSIDCLSGEVAPSPAYSDGTAYVAQEGSALSAIDVEKKSVVWKAEENLPSVASPVAAGGFVITAQSDSGKLACFDSRTGKLAWEHECESGFYSSPVAAGDNVYATDRTGVTLIFKAAAEWKEVAKCELGEGVDATPALVGGRIYMRGKNNLYCIGVADGK